MSIVINENITISNLIKWADDINGSIKSIGSELFLVTSTGTQVWLKRGRNDD